MQSPLPEKHERNYEEHVVTRRRQEEEFLKCIAELKKNDTTVPHMLTGAALGVLGNALFRARQVYQFVFGGMFAGLIYSRYQMTKHCSERLNFTREDRRKVQEYIHNKAYKNARELVGAYQAELDFDADFDRELSMQDSDYSGDLDRNVLPTEESNSVPEPKVTYDDLREKHREEYRQKLHPRITNFPKSQPRVEKSVDEQDQTDEPVAPVIRQRRNKYGDLTA